jgi:hypothetical protein
MGFMMRFRAPGRLRHSRVAGILVVMLIEGALALGCGHKPPPPSPPVIAPPAPLVIPPPPTPRAPVKLMWLPLDPMVHAKLGLAINGRLEGVRIAGVDSQDKAPVSMDVAQMSLDCSQPTPECFAAVGRHLHANRLIWADVARDKRKKVTVALSLFDVDQGKIAGHAQRTFANQKAALAGIAALVNEFSSSAGAGDKASGAGKGKP